MMKTISISIVMMITLSISIVMMRGAENSEWEKFVARKRGVWDGESENKRSSKNYRTGSSKLIPKTSSSKKNG